jgi:hypothetical protein
MTFQDNMKINIIGSIAALLLVISHVTLAQMLECPLAEGKFKDFSVIRYSHHDPNNGAVVLSDSNNEIKSVVGGKIVGLLHHSREEHSVVLMTSDSTIVAYRFMASTELQKGSLVNKGDLIGYAAKRENGLYGLSFSIWLRSRSVDPTKMCKCEK